MSQQEFELYNALEENFWWFKARREILSTFMTYITCPEKKRLLEIGCGTGGNLQYLFSEFQERIGLDYDAKAIKYAGQKLANTVQYLRGDANHLCFRESAVDCVAMLDVLYHKNIPDINEVLRQANRVLTPKGYLLISDGAFSFLQGRHNKAVHAARRFTRQELVSTLLQMNYRIVKASYWGIALFFLLFLKRAVFENLVPASGKNVNAYDLVKIPVVDSLLYWCVQSEQYFLKKYSFPLGASIAILAQKS